MSGPGQYSYDRKVTRAPPVNRVRVEDTTIQDDLRRRSKFREALDRAADEVRHEEQRRRHGTFDESKNAPEK